MQCLNPESVLKEIGYNALLFKTEQIYGEKMKRKLTNIVGTVITIALTVFLLQYMGHRLDPLSTETAFEAINAFHALPDNSCEVIVYGSSHAWKGCDTRVMYDKYGIEAYNYGCHWQGINTTLLFLQDSLRTQTPKVICVDTYQCNTVRQDMDMTGEIYYTRAIKNFDGKRKYLKKCFGDNIERYISYYFPIVMFHDNWNAVRSENYSKQNISQVVELRGFYPSDNIFEGEIPNYKDFSQRRLSDDATEILDEIVRSCREKNISIIFYTCPFMGEYRSYSNAMQKYCDRNNCVYLDLFQYCDDMGLNGETDFRDATHLNTNGAKKVADFLGKYIVENYNIN